MDRLLGDDDRASFIHDGDSKVKVARPHGLRAEYLRRHCFKV